MCLIKYQRGTSVNTRLHLTPKILTLPRREWRRREFDRPISSPSSVNLGPRDLVAHLLSIGDRSLWMKCGVTPSWSDLT